MAGNLGFPGGPYEPAYGAAPRCRPRAPTTRTLSAAGVYPYGTGMDFGVGSPGFTQPGLGVASVPRLSGAAGDRAELPMAPAWASASLISAQPDPRIAQEADRNRLEAERQCVGSGPRQHEFRADGHHDNRRQEEEQRRWAEENRRSIEEGGGGIPEPTYTVDSGILEGGYDPGDMGDVATTQGHTDYMSKARAMYAAKQREAQQQAAAAEAARQAFYTYQQQVQQQQQPQFNQNVVGLNPTNIFDTWAAGQSTQYQPY